MCLSECRGIVDAITGHGDHAPFGLQLADDLGLLVREHLRLDPVDPELLGHCTGRGPVITGQHNDLDTILVQRGNRLARRRLYRIGNGE